jgi:hypothetical protein
VANYHQVKNAAILTPTGSTDLGSDANRYSNVYMSGNIVMSNGVTVTSTNVITPKISAVIYPDNDTAADIAGGQTITITGSGFSAGASVLLGTTPSTVVTVVSGTSITFTSPVLAAGNYALYVINSDGGTAIYIPGIAYSGTPIWSTSSGSLSTVYETNSISSTVTATGDATISYSLNSGTLPTGSTLNSSTGLISGTAPASAGSTTYSFVIRATDGQNQDTNRSFTITVNTDAVTWVSPADNTSTTLDVNSAMSTVTLNATSAAGKSITYTANALPTGVSISTNTIIGTPTVVGSTTSLITATAATSNRTATRTLSWVVSVASDTYFPYTTLLLSGNGTNNSQNNTFIDSSTNNFAITRNGNATQGTFSPYGSNWSLYTNGTNSYAYLPYSATRSIGTGDFSIECWVYIAKQPADYTRVWSHQSNWGLAGSIGIELAFGTVDRLIQAIIDGNSTTYASATYDTGNGSGHVRQWIHVVSSRQNGYLRLFVNGILREATANSTNINGTSTTSFGTNSQLGGDLTELYISNFRMCIGSVPTLYSTTSTTGGTTIFTPSTTPLTTTSQGASGVQLLLFQDNRIIDRSSNAFAVTTVNNPSIQRFSPFNPTATYSTSTIGGSGYFDGTGDNIISASTTAFNLGSSNFSIEMWFYWNGTYPSGNGYAGLCGSNTDYKVALCIWNGSGGSIPKIMYGLSSNGSAWNILQAESSVGSNTVLANQWNHIVLCRNVNTISGFLNGVRDITVTSSASVVSRTEGYVVGAWFGTLYYFAGYISNFRFIVGATLPYNASDSTITVPTAPLTAITNTQLLTNFTAAGIIDNTMINNLETVGNAQISTAQSKFGGSSMYFDGTGDYLTIPSNPNLNFGKGDFTIEFWAYFNSLSSIPQLVNKHDGTSGWFLEAGSNIIYFGYAVTGAGGLYMAPSVTLTTGIWYHIAATRVGSSLSVFLNGVKNTVNVVNAELSYDNTAPLVIGRWPAGGYELNGYIDDLRITKGYARYTATFTPPTTALLTK